MHRLLSSFPLACCPRTRCRSYQSFGDIAGERECQDVEPIARCVPSLCAVQKGRSIGIRATSQQQVPDLDPIPLLEQQSFQSWPLPLHLRQFQSSPDVELLSPAIWSTHQGASPMAPDEHLAPPRDEVPKLVRREPLGILKSLELHAEPFLSPRHLQHHRRSHFQPKGVATTVVWLCQCHRTPSSGPAIVGEAAGSEVCAQGPISNPNSIQSASDSSPPISRESCALHHLVPNLLRRRRAAGARHHHLHQLTGGAVDLLVRTFAQWSPRCLEVRRTADLAVRPIASLHIGGHRCRARANANRGLTS
mmetsp:Transcript_27783/g.92372  ORF Transcript_27783/g.92372 Transcript_27783/m.92372 type:complete len:306 (+) Transcript_27783:2139-3056(+)